MLKALRIQSFAIIDELYIEFNQGMSTIIGETGAGKSIIIDAISLLMGQRANSSMVQSGKEKAIIEGVFSINQQSKIHALYDEVGIQIEDEIIIRREITKDGKSQTRLNMRMIPLSVLKTLMSPMIDIHSQFDTQKLLDKKSHLKFLDDFYEAHLKDAYKLYKKDFLEYQRMERTYLDLLDMPSDQEQLEFYQTRIQEIEDANLEEGELEQLEDEKKRMQQYEKTFSIINDIVQMFESDQGITSQLYEVSRLFSSIDDQQLEDMESKLDEFYYGLDDICERLKDYRENLVFDEYRFQEITDRIFLIHKLQKRYGYNISDILRKKNEMIEEVDLIMHHEELLKKAKINFELAKEQAYNSALVLSSLRKTGAIELANQIMSQLKDLYMPNAKFEVSFSETKTLTLHGMDAVEFLMSTNIGQELQPLQEVASGGELSRIMLGLKCIFNKTSNIETMIFDEVDTGVSGKVAQAIGRKIKEMSNQCQIFCITHLPQVASFADDFLYVYKQILNDRTQTQVRWLNNDQKVEELAKMMSGETISKEALENAKSMLIGQG